MADALISSTVKVTLERALSLASDRIGMLVGFKKDVASMTRSLRLINAVLADAEAKQNQDGAVQAWLECLEEVAYDATNVLDELKYESLRHKVESRNRHKLKEVEQTSAKKETLLIKTLHTWEVLKRNTSLAPQDATKRGFPIFMLKRVDLY
nr:putative disease resistance protein RGA4 [Coffea arabica]XP_027082323.1 putative disease resistance protein RGA4 [Coffea arabica]